MSKKFHINDDGKVGQCHAKLSCPFGDLEENHWDTAADARHAYETMQAAWGPIMSSQRKTRLVPTDFGDVAKDLYAADPDWHWLDGVQKFVSWDSLPVERKLVLISAAEGLASFINSFERDVPLSAIKSGIKKLSIHGASIDEES